MPKEQRKDLRSAIYLVSASLAKLKKSHAVASADDAKSLGAYKTSLDKTTNFIPLWVKIAVALALGLGTMIGWKRIVVTVGERIGKTHLTYGQGASAEIVAYGTIQAADIFGLPVSTTHILSSGRRRGHDVRESPPDCRWIRCVASCSHGCSRFRSRFFSGRYSLRSVCGWYRLSGGHG